MSDIKEVLITEEEIQNKVKEKAEEVSEGLLLPKLKKFI